MLIGIWPFPDIKCGPLWLFPWTLHICFVSPVLQPLFFFPSPPQPRRHSENGAAGRSQGGALCRHFTTVIRSVRSLWRSHSSTLSLCVCVCVSLSPFHLNVINEQTWIWCHVESIKKKQNYNNYCKVGVWLIRLRKSCCLTSADIMSVTVPVRRVCVCVVWVY